MHFSHVYIMTPFFNFQDYPSVLITNYKVNSYVIVVSIHIGIGILVYTKCRETAVFSCRCGLLLKFLTFVLCHCIFGEINLNTMYNA